MRMICVDKQNKRNEQDETNKPDEHHEQDDKAGRMSRTCRMSKMRPLEWSDFMLNPLPLGRGLQCLGRSPLCMFLFLMIVTGTLKPVVRYNLQNMNPPSKWRCCSLKVQQREVLWCWELRFHWCVGGCWDRTQGRLLLRHWLSDAITTRLDLILNG